MSQFTKATQNQFSLRGAVSDTTPSLVAMAGHTQKIVTYVAYTSALSEMLTQQLPGGTNMQFRGKV